MVNLTIIYSIFHFKFPNSFQQISLNPHLPNRMYFLEPVSYCGQWTELEDEEKGKLWTVSKWASERRRRYWPKGDEAGGVGPRGEPLGSLEVGREGKVSRAARNSRSGRGVRGKWMRRDQLAWQPAHDGLLCPSPQIFARPASSANEVHQGSATQPALFIYPPLYSSPVLPLTLTKSHFFNFFRSLTRSCSCQTGSQR